MKDNNIINELIGIEKEYVRINPSENKKGNGGNLSVKIVTPSYCQANCPFCFNKLNKDTQKHNYDLFFNNLDKSLEMIIQNINNRNVTIDITGNEPTYDISVFKELMNHLKKYRDTLKRVILTSNGYHLYDCINYMNGIIDLMNISLHHYDYNERKKIFNTSMIPNDEEVKLIVEKLKRNNISSTAVSVLYKEIDNFKEYYYNFMNYAINNGFKNIRMRSNFCANDAFIDDILKLHLGHESINELAGLTTKIIIDENTGFETRILKGVPDLTEYILGAELVIDDDGMCYVDYNKRYSVNENNINYFNYFYLIDNRDIKALKRRK